MTVAFNYLGKLGQLGNQMFQYAATLGVARHAGVAFTIPNHDELIVDALGNRLRIELFDCFDLNPDNIGLIGTDNVLAEKGFEFDSNILSNRQSDYTLYGFFQTEKYFKHCAEEVRSQFTFKKQIVNECKEIVEDCFEEPIALHIRRGDFLINSANHYNQSLDYYEAALSKFDVKRQVVIFSDDPKWCMEQELFEGNRFLVSEATGPYHDLYLMTQCSDFIIANSTFSWWGAWLADSEQIIAPIKWFANATADKSVKDMAFGNWMWL